MRKSMKGVTLIELLTVVVVIGILAAIAVPSYRAYLIRAQRSDASTALLRLQAAEEKFFLQNNAYTTKLPDAPTAGGLGLSDTSDRGFYALAVNLTATGYDATAIPVAGKGQADDTKCTTFKVNEIGKKTATNSGGADTTSDCWR
jgi:type IV pilus assembly protein PilE